VIWVDYDTDGDLDLSLGAGTENTNRFFINQLSETGSVSFQLSADAELSFPYSTRGFAWGILSESDSYPDLFMGAPYGDNVLLSNTETSILDVTDFVTAGGGQPTRGVRLIDYDSDGLLDIHELNDGAPDRLLKNLGSFAFEDVAIPPFNIIDGSVDAAWSDVDGDGDLDTYITRVNFANILLRNDGSGVFVDVTPTLLAESAQSQGATWGDYDNDGKLDLFLTNWGSSDRLFHNDGNFQFTEILSPFNETVRHGQSPMWGDFDNDGDLDLYVTNYGEANQFYLNLGNSRFVETAAGQLASGGSEVGAACGDYDQDGDLDIFTGWHMGANSLLRNEMDATKNWVDIRLEGVMSNTSAVGSRISLISAGMTQTREVGSNNGFWSQNPHTQHFGLGSEMGPVQCTIQWPSGQAQDTTITDVNCLVMVTEAASSAVEEGVNPLTFALHSCFPNPFNPSTTIKFSLPAALKVNLSIYDISGRLVDVVIAGEMMSKGQKEAVWYGRDESGRQVSAGVYFFHLDAGGDSETKRMVLIK